MPTAKIKQNQVINSFHTGLLLLAMAGLLGFTGYLLMGVLGFVTALVLLIIGIFFTRRASAAMVLRAYKARPIHMHEAPQLVEMFHVICQRAELDHQPGLFYIPTRLPNAFACGEGKRTAVAITDGLLRMLNGREIAGVLAHEVAHIMHEDLKVMATADAITRTISMLSRFGLMMMLFSVSGFFVGSSFFWTLLAALILFCGPAAVVLLQLAVSRTREFSADQGAAELTQDPMGLASALTKIEKMNGRPRGILERIMVPGQRRAQPAMLRTHPPTDERVEKLVELVDGNAPEELPIGEPPPRRIPISRPKVRRRPSYHWVNGTWY